MSAIKELWWLAKQLFKDNPKDRDEVTYKQMQHFPFAGYSAMSWCGYLVTRKDESSISESTRTHETIHLKQAQIKGSWIKFYLSYLKEWLKGNPIIHPSQSAYYTIPYEAEAYANQYRPSYPKNYDGSNLSKYTFKNRKSLYKSYGKQGYLQYIRSL